MKALLAFVKATFIGGMLFLVPVVATIMILSKAVKFGARILHPVEQLLPNRTVVGIAVADILAVIALLAIGVAAGLFAQTVIGQRVSHRVERLILSKIPGYTLLKGVAEDSNPLGGKTGMKVALANIDDAWLLAFIVEQLEDGDLVVFVPSAPTPTAGNVYMMTERQVRRLDVPVSAAVKCIMRLGVGVGDLVRLQRAKQQKGTHASA